MPTQQVRVAELTATEWEKIIILTAAERKQALLRAAEDKAKEIFGEDIK